jgi:RNA polymerase sigma-70 factor (ECF subfamily)
MVLSDTYSETDIIKQILAGDKSLYEIIVRRYNPYLYKLGRSFNFNHEDTQDLMQDTYIDAYRNLTNFRGDSKFKTWIFRIMMNNCYRKKEKSSFKNEISQEVKDYSKPLFSNADLDTGALAGRRELAGIIEDALSRLPLEYRMVFSLREINDMNVAETANLLNITETNVKVRLNRAKTMLRREIENNYSNAEIFEFNLIYCDAITANVMHKINEL